MDFKGLRLPLIVLTLAVALVGLFGVRWVYQDQALNRPLEQAIRSVAGVVDASLSREGNIMVVRVRAHEVERLEELVASLWRSIATLEGRQEVRLHISDTRTDDLQETYYHLHFFLQEAVSTGHYSALPQRLAAVAEARQVTRCRVFVASDYVYLQLHRGESSLYAIVPRGGDGVSNGSGGSSAVRSVTVSPWEG